MYNPNTPKVDSLFFNILKSITYLLPLPVVLDPELELELELLLPELTERPELLLPEEELPPELTEDRPELPLLPEFMIFPRPELPEVLPYDPEILFEEDDDLPLL